MGDMADTFNALKEHNKCQRAKRLQAASTEGWSKHTEYHWYRFVGDKKINYWPTTGLVMIGPKKYGINSKYIKSLINQTAE